MGLRVNLQEKPITLTGKSMVSGSDFPRFPLNQSIHVTEIPKPLRNVLPVWLRRYHHPSENRGCCQR